MLQIFDRTKETMYEIKSRRLRLQPFRKNVIVEEELDCIDIDDIGNLEDSPRLVFIDEECGNLLVVNDGGETFTIA